MNSKKDIQYAWKAPWSETVYVCSMDILLKSEKELIPKILTIQI